MKYLLSAVVCFVCAIGLIPLLTGCASQPKSKINIGKLEIVTHKSVDEWIAQVENDTYGRYPLQPVGFKDPSAFTGWNKFWAGSALIGQTGDTVSTINALDSGKCSEGNPLMGSNPSTGAIVAFKLLVGGTVIWIAEYALKRHPKQQFYRNWLYGTLAVAGVGATVWNSSLDCN